MWKRPARLDVSASAIKSARRVFEVLEEFDRLQRPLTLKEIADGLAYPTSSAQALLKSLVVLGYLEYDRPSRTYLPTMRIAAVGRWVAEGLFGNQQGWGEVLPVMRGLRDETGETVMLGVRSDLFAHYVHVVRGEDAPLTTAPAPGSVRPLGRCGIGRLLLSALPDAEIDLIVRRINIAEPGARLDVTELMDDIAEIRHRRHVFSRHLFAEGTGAIAVLAPEGPHGRRMALGVGGPVERLESQYEAHLARLRAAAGSLTGRS
jgi:DNA-binding IclR family transcriptional regulator